MKQYLFKFIIFLCGSQLYAQGGVGINTEEPTATLHVKTDNDYILRQEDNTDTSSGTFTIQSSDNFGTFKKVSTDVFRRVQIAMLPSTGTTITTLDPSWQTTILSITIPPGKWQITGALAMYPSSDLSKNSTAVINCKMTVADAPGSTTPSGDIVNGAGYFLGSYNAPSRYQIMKGNIYVNNTSGGDKTYYFIANIKQYGTDSGLKDFGSSDHLENQIFALPVY